jgi:hypothetical protein
LIRLLLVYLMSFALAGARIGGLKTEAFQAVAHLWVGALLAAWILNRNKDARKLAIALSVIELACFIVSKLWGP